MIQNALKLQRCRLYLVLAAQIYQELNCSQPAQSALEESFKLFGPVSSLSEWELGWFRTVAQMAQGRARLDQTVAEITRHKRQRPAGEAEGVFPEIAPALPKS